ncbi:hypothetical protein TraAM80_09737 [Trypanosoma rangeli]|uniref:Uncharacterized protein n=1 Tax=Trypanosoma rangeli TaxID=5698 RepID=A0A3R7M5J3_TRYRA|nr:uncharacterized protein TraAM80_09737 [Trypanosoma rangeli]RNE96556.1 hypothetical protein TraAM80_09737 [Trypanosoma rangeli]|eukprot:RNE96556.1 hypothetical protein TraAM80_09737 [Trypanosoma rangeli]
MLVEAEAGNRMGLRPPQPEEARNPTSSPSAAPLGESFTPGHMLLHKSTGAESASCHRRWSNNESGTASAVPSYSSRLTDGPLTSSYNSSEEVGSVMGMSLVFKPVEGWGPAQAHPPPPDRYAISLEEARYNANAVKGERPGNDFFRVDAPLPGWSLSGGAVLRGGMCCMRNAAAEFNQGGMTASPSLCPGGDDTPVPSAVPRVVASVCTGATATPGERSPLETQQQQQRPWPAVEPPRVVTPSSFHFSTFDGESHLKEKTLRFKMLPSPVPFEKFFAGTRPRPALEWVNQYRSTMVRWYKRIVLAQENTRARVRQRCPSPPKGLIDEAMHTDTVGLQSWAEQCCRWWDETSRKRTRRGHRGGKTLGNAGNSQTTATQQQRTNEHAPPAGDDKTHVIGHPLLSRAVADSSEPAPLEDTEEWIKRVKKDLEETFLEEDDGEGKE